MSTRYPKEAVTPRVGDQRAGEPEQSPTPGSFAGLVNREEVIAKPRTQTCAAPVPIHWHLDEAERFDCVLCNPIT